MAMTHHPWWSFRYA